MTGHRTLHNARSLAGLGIVARPKRGVRRPTEELALARIEKERKRQARARRRR